MNRIQALAVALCIGLGSTVQTAALAAGGTSLSALDDRELPAFELDGIDGERWDPAALRGKPWIVNFWATWCAPCIEELPAMNEAAAALGDQVGMLAINAGEGREAVEAFIDKVPVEFPIALGDGATTLPNWQVRALPTTLVVAPDGRVVYEALGPRDWNDEALLDRVRALVSP